jgi:hypothetical protein
MALVAFLASQSARLTRIGAGIALVIAGVLLGGGWIVLAIVGLLPIAAGMFDFCVLSPVLGLPFGGKGTRAACAARH